MWKARLAILIFAAFISVSICPPILGAPETKVSVDPARIEVKVNQTFTVNINVTDVYRLKGFDFRLSYSTTILELKKVEEGPFMKSVGNTFMINLTTKGLVWLAVVVYDPQGVDVAANGSGVLATITFKAIAVGECVLDLHSADPYRPNEVKLARGCEVEHIPNVAFDGRVIVSYNTCNSDPADPPSDPPSDPSDPPDPLDPPQDPPAEKSPDINGDGKVNIEDVYLMAKAFGSRPGHSKWDERADLNNDQKVGINDVFIMAKNFEA
jgi:hypothetical protein